jgi:hypothetical protein
VAKQDQLSFMPLRRQGGKHIGRQGRQIKDMLAVQPGVIQFIGKREWGDFRHGTWFVLLGALEFTGRENGFGEWVELLAQFEQGYIATSSSA